MSESSYRRGYVHAVNEIIRKSKVSPSEKKRLLDYGDQVDSWRESNRERKVIPPSMK